MNTPHTPGPWAVDGQYIRSSQFHLAIMTRPDSGMMAEWRANRNLIAAAPDLMEALHNLVARGLINPDGDHYDEAIEALSKATGQTP